MNYMVYVPIVYLMIVALGQMEGVRNRSKYQMRYNKMNGRICMPVDFIVHTFRFILEFFLIRYIFAPHNLMLLFIWAMLVVSSVCLTTYFWSNWAPAER